MLVLPKQVQNWQKIMISTRFVTTWLLQCRHKEIPISGPVIYEEAWQFNEKLNGNPNFHQSLNYVTVFIK